MKSISLDDKILCLFIASIDYFCSFATSTSTAGIIFNNISKTERRQSIFPLQRQFFKAEIMAPRFFFFKHKQNVESMLSKFLSSSNFW